MQQSGASSPRAISVSRQSVVMAVLWFLSFKVVEAHLLRSGTAGGDPLGSRARGNEYQRHTNHWGLKESRTWNHESVDSRDGTGANLDRESVVSTIFRQSKGKREIEIKTSCIR